jgi:hypothetical protein
MPFSNSIRLTVFLCPWMPIFAEILLCAQDTSQSLSRRRLVRPFHVKNQFNHILANQSLARKRRRVTRRSAVVDMETNSTPVGLIKADLEHAERISATNEVF